MTTRLLAAVLFLSLPAFAKTQAPTSRPTTSPALIDLKPIQIQLDKATAVLEAAKHDALARWEASETFREMKAKVDGLRAKLDAARTGDDARAKLDASAAYNAARLGMEAEARKQTATPQEESAVALARKELDESKTENRRRIDAMKQNDPIQKAIREKRLAKGMTKEQVLQVFPYTDETTVTESGERVVFIEEADLPRTATVYFVNGKVVSFDITSKRLSDFRATPGKP